MRMNSARTVRARTRGPALAVALVLTMLPAGLAAQDTRTGTQASWDAGQLFATRAELEAMLKRFETETQIYSEQVRAIADDEAELIRNRLREGDFEVGDQITVTVPGQATLTGQFLVAPGRYLVLPTIGGMPLTGLLRSELQDSLRSFIGRFFRNAEVYVQTSMRIQVFGEVGQPGYHEVPADARLPDVLALVGQPTQNAKIERIRVRRAGETIWDGDALQAAIIEGRTLDQLSIRAGDVLEVPGASGFRIGTVLQSLYYVVPLSYLISRIF